MISLSNLILCGIFLLAVQFLARMGLPHRSFSASEAFVVAHWAFLYLNMLLLYFTGGASWTSLQNFSYDTQLIAELVIGVGLIAFTIGSMFASQGVRSQNIRLSCNLNRVKAADVFLVGFLLVLVGALSATGNAESVRVGGWVSQRTPLLAASQLLVPGTLLCCLVVSRRNSSLWIRLLALMTTIVGLISLTQVWSRIPLLVVLCGGLLLKFSRKFNLPDRRAIVFATPFLICVVILGIAWRNWFFLGQDFLSTSVLEFYSERIWLDSSAFSALMLIIEKHGLLAFRGGGSLIMPLVFWIPRSIFPGKPEALNVNELAAVTYSIAPSLYGEVLLNLSIFGLVAFMFFVGYFLKRIDLGMVARREIPSIVRLVYVIFLVDTVFVVRGAFYTTVYPILLHCLLPPVMIAGCSFLRQSVERFIKDRTTVAKGIAR